MNEKKSTVIIIDESFNNSNFLFTATASIIKTKDSIEYLIISFFDKKEPIKEVSNYAVLLQIDKFPQEDKIKYLTSFANIMIETVLKMTLKVSNDIKSLKA